MKVIDVHTLRLNILLSGAIAIEKMILLEKY